MNRLILDFFKRKAWILGLGAVAEFCIGFAHVAIAGRPGDNPFAAFQFQIGLFMGAFLLSLDLQRGATRTVATLPLTARQIGHAWWAATVGIPALVYSVLLIAGAASYCLFHPTAIPNWGQLTFSALALLLWMGTAFTVVFNTLPAGRSGNWWQRTRGILFGVFWGFMIGGGPLFFHDLPSQPVKLAGLLAIGLGMTLFGWFRAEHLVLGRASFRAGTETGGGQGEIRAHRPGGFGGLGLLISQTCLRVFRIGLAMLVAMPAFALMQGRLKSWEQALTYLSGPGFFPWFVLLFALVPVIQQLRLLRSLPISATTLALTLLALIVLPMIALGTLATGVLGLGLGVPAALGVAKSCLLMLVPAALVMSIVSWRGLDRPAYILLILTVMLSQFASTWLHLGGRDGNISTGMAGLAAAIAVGVAFLLTRLALQRGNHAYRVQVSQFVNAWGTNR